MNRSDRRRKIWNDRELNNLCIYCGKNEPVVGKKGCKSCLEEKVSKTSKFSKNNREKINQYNLLNKHIVIEKYGGKCNCCGESQILFLTIDHINNDGSNDRSNKNYTTRSFYMKLKKEPIRDDIQVLCFNCNLGKSINGGVCPHKLLNRVLNPIYDGRHNPQFDTRLKIVWPDDDELIEMCNEKSISQVSKELKVNFSAVSGRLKRRNKYHLVKKKSGMIRYGEDNPSSKLTEDIVKSIRENFDNEIGRKEISIKYNVSISLIDKILNNKLWKKL